MADQPLSDKQKDAIRRIQARQARQSRAGKITEKKETFSTKPEKKENVPEYPHPGKRKFPYLLLILAFLAGGLTVYLWHSLQDEKVYQIGDKGPAGGLIFYDKGSYSDGWRYLEAAPEFEEWETKAWGSYGTWIGETETGIGTGKSNTTIIVSWLDSNGEKDCAAQLCDALVCGGYSDWFLPSKDELALMYKNLKVYGVGGFADGAYWSSSEYSADHAWKQDFSNGTQYYYKMGAAKYLSVRAVRAF